MRAALNRLAMRMAEYRHRGRTAAIGSAEWLIQTEIRYGGLITNVPRNKVSDADPRSEAEVKLGGMTGGDRMLHHGYAPIYARFLAPYLNRPNVTVAEFGILTGSGLALWCDLFPNGYIFGFDIDLEHFRANEPRLQSKGAFKQVKPHLFEFDQLLGTSADLSPALQDVRLDVVIDDGLHTREAIIRTFKSVRPFLAEDFVYFVEDFEGLCASPEPELSDFTCLSFGLMSVILPKAAQVPFA